MPETFFTSKEAAQLTGCTLPLIQYWREKGIVVLIISDTGTERSISIYDEVHFIKRIAKNS